jgi:hypothetical protein
MDSRTWRSRRETYSRVIIGVAEGFPPTRATSQTMDGYLAISEI